MSTQLLQHEPPTRMYHPSLHLQQQQQQQQQRMQQQQEMARETDRHVLRLNNRACVMVLAKQDYSEANKLFDAALMIHKQQTEYENHHQNHHNFATGTTTVSQQQQQQQQMQYYETNQCMDHSTHSYDLDFSEGDLSEYDDEFGDMDCDYKEPVAAEPAVAAAASTPQQQQQQQQLLLLNPLDDSCRSVSYTPTAATTTATASAAAAPQSPAVVHRSNNNHHHHIARMTSYSRLRSIAYSGQQAYHEERTGMPMPDHTHHQVYSLPIVMDEHEWDTAPVQDKSFVLIFNTALCNHLWGMNLMEQYMDLENNHDAAAAASSSSSSSSSSMAQHCRETLTVAKLLYKLALENSVSFANGVDKMCYVALYNNLSHVCKTLEGYDSVEAQWCDDMLLKAIFWWRDTTHQSSSSSNNNSNHHHHSAPSQSRGSSEETSSNNNHNNNGSSSSDMYLDGDAEIMDAFFDNVYYRVGVSEDIAPAAAA